MALCNFIQTISFIYLSVVLTCSVASSLIHDDECLALLRFKQSILHQDDATFSPGGFPKLDSWRKIARNTSSNDSAFDCCLWDGVACSSEGHVIALDLSQCFLQARINSNSSLFDLVHLQKLNLSKNNLVESQIPSEIARLKNLRTLDLSNSGFSGQIPNEISHLVQLSVLDLSMNSLNLKSFSFEYLLRNLTRLEKLHLSMVDIGTSIPHFLANFSSLRSIDLGDCHLRDEFPTGIFHLPNLNYLNMNNNPDLTGFIPEFRNNTVLENLDLRGTGFGGIIPESISNINRLQSLSLSQCNFSGAIPRSIANLTQLTILQLGFNKFTGQVPSMESLSNLIVFELGDNNFEKGSTYDWIGKLTNLNYLSLNRMNIYGELLPSLANLTELSFVSVGNNFITGHIPSSFMNLTQLSVVSLGENDLRGPIPSAFSNFKSLASLNLGSNNFSGRVDLDTFVGLSKLNILNLGSNRISFVETNNYTDGTLPQFFNLGLSSCNLKEFPAFLAFQKNLNALFLSGNKIEGLIPTWIWNNSQETMQIIDLSSNSLTGFQEHPHFLPWARLKTMSIGYNQLQGKLPVPPETTTVYDFSYNNLTGEIPSSICEVKSLQVLDLSYNNMTGTLPPCLHNVSNLLSVLNLKRNNFHGTTPNTFTHGSMLNRIDISENQFTGQLSKSLANCTNLEVLSVGDNYIEDVFPFWLGSLAQLQVLILRSNKFYGPIEGSRTNMSHFSNLRIIDLANNRFSGQLPEKYFQSLKAMKASYVPRSLYLDLNMDFGSFPGSYDYTMTLTNKGVKTEYKKILNIFTAIDLSSNKFEGEIPETLHDLQGLESLNLSNNRLTGHILPSFGNLKNLESLDLSQNKLSGEIPQQLLQLGFLAILNVSFNHLDGRIPQGKQFNTFENNSYTGNPRLCGKPLSKECRNSKASTLPTMNNNESESESLLPGDIIDWTVIITGVGCGLVIGIVVGNILYARYSDWFINRFGTRK